MIVKLLTEHHLEFISLKGGCTGSSEFTLTCQNTTLLEITCHSSLIWVKEKEQTILKMVPKIASLRTGI